MQKNKLIRSICLGEWNYAEEQINKKYLSR